jgi:glycosyltransferase involved in cell wall biosynthesis
VFAHAAHRIAKDWNKVHFAYPSLQGGMADLIPPDVTRFVELDFSSGSVEEYRRIERYVRQHGISVAIGFDQPVRRGSYRYLRKGGVTRFMSYWGAPTSSINSGIKLLLKRLEVWCTPFKPDLFVFQSHGMRKTAVRGRGIPFSRTRVVRTGVDVTRFVPDFHRNRGRVHEIFGIPRNRKVIYYSGHVVRRKGVHVLLRAIVHLVEELGRNDLHFLFVGNRGLEADQFLGMYAGTEARHYVTFGGYRDDLETILPGCYAGVLATTGWDSFPVSTIEISAAGLPLLVSDLLGVRETVIDGVTGFRFPPGDHRELARLLVKLADDAVLRERLGRVARRRVERGFRREQQIERFVRAIASID